MLAYESSKPRWKKPSKAPADKHKSNNGEEWLRCVRCGANITKQADRTQHGGLHEHSQVNPHGYIWVFGIFRDAPGVRTAGNPTEEFTWFIGYRWRLIECASCALHLGWLFDGPDDSFWGLILERLLS